MIGWRYLAVVLLLSVASLTVSALGRKRETGFLNRAVSAGSATYRYQVYVPADWSKHKKWPVILFLHGAGERGDDGLIQTEVGMGTAVRRHLDRFPCLVVFPQCRRNVWWLAPEMETQALRALEQAIKEFNGDPQRVYLTGISMGGYGTWNIAPKYPGKFAALVPVCGGVRLPPSARNLPGMPSDPPEGRYAEIAQKIGSVPVWVFHGSADTAVPVAESRKMVEALKAAGRNVKYTEYEGVGHNSWDRAYAEPELLPWMLAQRLGGGEIGRKK